MMAAAPPRMRPWTSETFECDSRWRAEGGPRKGSSMYSQTVQRTERGSSWVAVAVAGDGWLCRLLRFGRGGGMAQDGSARSQAAATVRKNAVPRWAGGSLAKKGSQAQTKLGSSGFRKTTSRSQEAKSKAAASWGTAGGSKVSTEEMTPGSRGHPPRRCGWRT